MPPPTKLKIATDSVTRLIKEEASYHKEALQQAERISKLKAAPEDENTAFMIAQEVGSQAIEGRYNQR